MADLGKTVAALPRAAILHAAESARLQRLVQRHGRRVGAARFVAGETLDECVAVLRKLNDAGLHANTTLLGEAIPDAAGAAAVTDEYEQILERLVAEKLKANVALKLTHLGLAFDEEVAYANVERLVARAGELGTFLRIDMEQSEYVEVTLRIYERLRDAGHDSVGTVLQSYLYRTPDDLERLLPRAPNLRIVKGAYLEPDSIAYPEKRDVDRAYLELVQRGLAGVRTSPSRRTTSRSSGRCRRSRRARASRASASSSRCSTACGPGSSARSRPRGTRCSSRRRSAPTGTRTSCVASPSGRRISGSS